MDNVNSENDELQAQYDESLFTGAARGKYAERFKSGTNLVKLAPDVAAAFPNEESVNNALRFVQQVAADAHRLTSP